jgi:hypothetical protein
MLIFFQIPQLRAELDFAILFMSFAVLIYQKRTHCHIIGLHLTEVPLQILVRSKTKHPEC